LLITKRTLYFESPAWNTAGRRLAEQYMLLMAERTHFHKLNLAQEKYRYFSERFPQGAVQKETSFITTTHHPSVMQNRICSHLLLAAAIILTTVTACKKDNDNTTDPAVASATEALRSQQLITSSFGIALRGAQEADGLVSQSVDDRCGSVTISPLDPAVFPKVITLDYGTGCTDSDGKTRSGKVTLTVEKIWEPGSAISLQYDNYKEDNAQLSGKFTFKNESTPGAGIFSILAEDIQAADGNGNTLAYDAVQTFTQTAGFVTWWDWSDDVYNITGTIQSVLTNGETVSWTIQTPLVKANNCFWISAGTGTLNINGLDALVDYGDGTCDNKATVTVNGQTFPITL